MLAPTLALLLAAAPGPGPLRGACDPAATARAQQQLRARWQGEARGQAPQMASALCAAWSTGIAEEALLAHPVEAVGALLERFADSDRCGDGHATACVDGRVEVVSGLEHPVALPDETLARVLCRLDARTPRLERAARALEQGAAARGGRRALIEQAAAAAGGTWNWPGCQLHPRLKEAIEAGLARARAQDEREGIFPGVPLAPVLERERRAKQRKP